MAAWSTITITISFLLLKAIAGLRVSEEEEIVGLDSTEHGLASAYFGFSIMDVSNTMSVNVNTDLGTGEYDQASEAQRTAVGKITAVPSVSDSGWRRENFCLQC